MQEIYAQQLEKKIAETHPITSRDLARTISPSQPASNVFKQLEEGKWQGTKFGRHEVDISLSDLAADVRAATPMHAAQLLWPQRKSLVQHLDALELRLTGLTRRYLERWEREVRKMPYRRFYFRRLSGNI